MGPEQIVLSLNWFAIGTGMQVSLSYVFADTDGSHE